LPETLSQEEIDALLMSFNSDEVTDKPAETKQEKKYKEHDFNNPKFFSKDQLKNINVIYDNYAKHLSQFMSGVLRTECNLTINAVEEQRYFEYSNALPESIMMGVLDVKPLEGNMLIEIKKGTCYTIIERLLGGDGDAPFEQIDFTDIELKLLERFYNQIIRFLKDSWANVTDMEPELDRLETNSRLTQIMPIDDIVIIVLMSVKIKEHEGSMSICIPCINLEQLLGQAASYAMMNRKRRKDDIEKTRASILEHVKTSKLDIRGILGSTTLTLQELSHLQVGDVIPMDKAVDSPIVLRIGAVDWFDGEIGARKNKIAVKIKNNILRKSQ
jgi:flagellar motor switch protein FliM